MFGAAVARAEIVADGNATSRTAREAGFSRLAQRRDLIWIDTSLLVPHTNEAEKPAPIVAWNSIVR